MRMLTITHEEQEVKECSAEYRFFLGIFELCKTVNAILSFRTLTLTIYRKQLHAQDCVSQFT